MQILDGIRVLDVTQFISGSRCTQILADMGAEVVKIEPPYGETMRLILSLMPGAERNYSVLNRNKYGITLDWRKPEGLEVMRKLVKSADIFVHNLIPGTLERAGLGYEDLKKIKNDIICISISGFGASGINPERAAFDIIAQATSGQFWYDTDDVKPPTNHWADLTTGSYAAIASLLAIIHKMKTGEGQFIDISMQDVLYFNNYRAMMDKGLQPVMGDIEKALGRKTRDVLNSDDRMPFYGFFKSSDGKVAIVALTQRQWKDLTNIIGYPEMAEDPKFSNLIAQVKNHQEAVERIEKWTSAHTEKEIVEILEAKKIPCGIAYTVEQVIADENLKSRNMFETVRHEKYGDIDIPGIPYKFSQTPGSIRMPGPDLGQHTKDILTKWLNYNETEINDLKTKGVI
jgi:crotonobetainyl-CoA:carnitine CoA-transferase CaiB-like acyl-CoA transferase